MRIRIPRESFTRVAAFLTLLASSCSPDMSTRGSSGRAEAIEGAQVHPVAYERGAWRMAPLAELNRTVLWVSHILIRHEQARSNDSPLRPFGWSVEAPSTRSRADAEQLAQRIAEMAHANPAIFERLAARYSEDEITRRHGGSLGARRASALPSTFLDAIAALEPGQTSRVLSTALGYHVLLVRNPPPEARVAGRRVVIRYATTSGRDLVKRSRNEARTLASVVLRKALDNVPFEQLIEAYSEGDDRVLGGALGTHSSREPSAEPIAIETLATVEVGEVVGEVLESRMGFQVLQRVEPTDPVPLEAEAAFFPVDPNRTGTAAVADARARRLLAKAALDPDAVGAHSDAPPVRLRIGRTDPLITAAVQQLTPGEVADEPIAIDGGLVVVRRLDAAASCSPTRWSYELPNPRVTPLPAIDELVQTSEPQQLVNSLRQVQGLVVGSLTSEARPHATRAFSTLSAALEDANTPAKRLEAYRAALATLHRTLGEARYAQITSVLQRWVSRQLSTLHRE